MTDEINEKNSLFNYQLSQGKEVFVISMTGILNGRAAKEFQECLEKIEEADCRFLILNFKNVEYIETTAYRYLVQIQHAVRKVEGKSVWICGINTAWRSALSDDGIIRGQEIRENVKAALLEVKKGISKMKSEASN